MSAYNVGYMCCFMVFRVVQKFSFKSFICCKSSVMDGWDGWIKRLKLLQLLGQPPCQKQ